MSDLHVLLFNASVVTAIIGAIAAVAKIWHSSLDRRRLAVNALFAELAHVTRHYEISAGELSDPEDVATLLRRLKWSKYGPVSGSSHLQDLAILGPQQWRSFCNYRL